MGFDPVNVVRYCRDPQKAHPWPETRVWRIDRPDQSTNATMARNVENKKKKKKTRNSSGDETANVNFLYDDIVQVLQNTIDSCINSATDRRGGYVLECMFTKFSEITQCNGRYAIQGHSKPPILVPIKSSYTTSY